MIPRSVRAIFFDAVGTLIHPDPPAVEVYAAVARLGSRLDAAEIGARFRAPISREEVSDWAADLRTSEEREERRWRRIVGDVLDDVTEVELCFSTLFAHFGDPANWRCTPGTAETLTELSHRGYLLGLASNFDSRLRQIVAGRPELSPLRHLAISSEVGWRKPAPQFFAAVSHAVALSSEQILLVGDDPVNDVEERAPRASIRSCSLQTASRPATVAFDNLETSSSEKSS